MTNLLSSSPPHLRVSDYDDCEDHYRISATGTQELKACPDYGHDDFYGHGAQRQSFTATPIHGKRILIAGLAPAYQGQAPAVAATSVREFRAHYT